MTSLLQFFHDVVTSYESEAIIVAGYIGLSAAGLIPRIGMIRPVTLRWRNIFKRTYPQSIRRAEVDKLRNHLRPRPWFRGIILGIRGTEGIGKSCLVNTVVSGQPSVIDVQVYFLFSWLSESNVCLLPFL
jgi:hypothetical protein